VYVARKDKATKFGHNTARHGGEPALVECLITYSRPKFVTGNDDEWQREGYDACRADRTSASQHMEWCVKDPSQVTVLHIMRL